MTASIGEGGNSSCKIVRCFQTGQSSHSAKVTSESVCIDQMTSEAVPSTSFPIRDRYKKPQKKIDFSSFRTLSKYESKKEPENANATIGVLCDDQFYNDIDLDEFDTIATSILKQNLDLPTQKQDANP